MLFIGAINKIYNIKTQLKDQEMRFSILYCRSVDYNIIPVPGRAKISRFLHLMNFKYTNTYI